MPNTCEASVGADQRASRGIRPWSTWPCLCHLCRQEWKPYVSTQARVIRSACDVWLIIAENKQVSAEQQAEDRREKRWGREEERINILDRRKPFTVNDHHIDRLCSMALMWYSECCMLSGTWLCELRIQAHHFKQVLQNLLWSPRHYPVSGATQNKTHPSLIKKHWLLMLNDTATALNWFKHTIVCLWLLHLPTDPIYNHRGLGRLKMKGSLG